MVRSLEGKHPGYYEAILQLREISSAVIDFVESEINRAKVPITKTVEMKNGLDIYLADSNFSKALGKTLQQKFGGEILITAKLHTRIKDKDIYRLTVLFRGVPFQRGDTVEYHGETYLVTAMGKEIILQHAKTGQKKHVRYTEMSKIKHSPS